MKNLCSVPQKYSTSSSCAITSASQISLKRRPAAAKSVIISLHLQRCVVGMPRCCCSRRFHILLLLSCRWRRAIIAVLEIRRWKLSPPSSLSSSTLSYRMWSKKRTCLPRTVRWPSTFSWSSQLCCLQSAVLTHSVQEETMEGASPSPAAAVAVGFLVAIEQEAGDHDLILLARDHWHIGVIHGVRRRFPCSWARRGPRATTRSTSRILVRWFWGGGEGGNERSISN